MTTKPYLSLRDRISQAWINRYTILLILIAVKLILFQQSLRNSLKMVQTFTISSCPSIDSFASNSVSIPHYLSKSANFMILKSMEEMNDKTQTALKLMLTGSENLIVFAIEMIIGTYACVLVSTIDGAVDVAVNSTEHVIGWVNNTLGHITDDINEGLTDLSKVIDKVVSTAEKVKDFFSDDDSKDNASNSLKKVNLTISGLKNLQIPSSINDKLERLKEKTPDFDTVKNKTEDLIRTPFDLVRSKIDNYTFMAGDDSDKMFVPPLIESRICSDNTDKINEFYETVNKDISVLLKVFVAVLIIGAILALVPIIWEEFRNWRKLQNLRQSIEEHEDPTESYEAAFNKYPTRAGILLSRLSDDYKNRTTIRWMMAYILSSRSLTVLGIGLAGILAVTLQFSILHCLNRSISNNQAPFRSMTADLTSQLDGSIKSWADSTNDYINGKQTEMNKELFSWIRSTTESVNNTVSEFVTDMNMAISDAFNGTILYNPVKTIVGCVIESKLLKIEQGLTWIHNNSEITLPKVNEDYISKGISPNTSDANTTNADLVSKSQEMVSKTEDMMMSMLKTTIRTYKKSLMFELYIAFAILGIWFFQLIVALIVGAVNYNFGTSEDNFRHSKDYDISQPRQLTQEEQMKYGYPFSVPLAVYPKSNNSSMPTILQVHSENKEQHEYKSAASQNQRFSSQTAIEPGVDLHHHSRSSDSSDMSLRANSNSGFQNTLASDSQSSISEQFERNSASRVIHMPNSHGDFDR